jgi:ORF6N domain
VSPAKKTAATVDVAVALPRIESRIIVVRGHKVLIDADLATLYDVPTKALNQAIKRNADRFPGDFMFQLTAAEKAEVVTNCDHLQKLKFSKALPYAFTEYGAIQAANVLNSPRAVEMGLYVVRAFVRLKEAATSHTELAKRLTDLEEKTEALAINHDVFSRNTKAQLKQVFDALRELMIPPDPPKRPIGFVEPADKGNKTKGELSGPIP